MLAGCEYTTFVMNNIYAYICYCFFLPVDLFRFLSWPVSKEAFVLFAIVPVDDFDSFTGAAWPARFSATSAFALNDFLKLFN